MSETTLFVSGFICFSLTVLGVVLTMIEFRKKHPEKPARHKQRASTGRYSDRPATVLS